MIFFCWNILQMHFISLVYLILLLVQHSFTIFIFPSMSCTVQYFGLYLIHMTQYSEQKYHVACLWDMFSIDVSTWTYSNHIRLFNSFSFTSFTGSFVTSRWSTQCAFAQPFWYFRIWQLSFASELNLHFCGQLIWFLGHLVCKNAPG